MTDDENWYEKQKKQAVNIAVVNYISQLRGKETKNAETTKRIPSDRSGNGDH